MDNQKSSKHRIRAVVRQGSRMIHASAAFIVLTAIASLVPTSTVVRIVTSAGGMLPAHVFALTAIEPSIFTVIALVFAGIALFFNSKHKVLPPLAVVLLVIAVGLFYGSFTAGITLLLTVLSALFMLLSVIGWRWNVAPRFMPPRFSLPVLNLISALLVLFTIPQVARSLESYISLTKMPPIMCYLYMAVWLLPLVSLLLVNLASEARPVDTATTKATVRAVPQGSIVLAVASWLLLICGAANLLIALFTSYNTSAFLLALPLLAAGLLLTLGKVNGKRFIAASVCLFLSIALTFFNTASYTTLQFWTYSIPILLMLISAIGAIRNAAPAFLSKMTRAPILNVLAAVLLIIGMLGGISSTLEQNAAVVEAREASLIVAAEDAGAAVAYSAYVRQTAEEALAAFDEAEAAVGSALDNLDGLADKSQLAAVREEISLAMEEMAALRVPGNDPFAAMDEAVAAFTAVLGKASSDALAVYEEVSAERTTSIEGQSGTAPAVMPESPSSQADMDGEDLFEIANNAIDTFYTAESAATHAVSRLSGTADEVEEVVRKTLEDSEAAILRAKESGTAWYSFVLSLLIPVGLILLNLSLGSQEMESQGIFAAFMHTSHRIFRWFYRDVGGKLQILAKIQAVICMVLACVSTITAAIGLCGFLVNYFFAGSGFDNLVIFVTGLGGVLAAFILALPTWFLYAFGQITADVHEVKENGGFAAPAYIEENPDDLPEL